MSKPYLPAMPVEDTLFPQAEGMDLWNAGRLIVERYQRYPTIEYYSLAKRTAPTADPHFPASEPTSPPPITAAERFPGPSPRHFTVLGVGFVTGRIGLKPVGNTQFDALWGEPVPPGAQNVGWKQPHANPDAGGATLQAVKVWTGPYYFHAKVVEDPQQKDLRRYGFDETRDLIVTVPVHSLDAAGVRVQIGDYLVWDDTRYEVLQMSRAGRWHNSNQKLYLVLACNHRREGS